MQQMLTADNIFKTKKSWPNKVLIDNSNTFQNKEDAWFYAWRLDKVKSYYSLLTFDIRPESHDE